MELNYNRDLLKSVLTMLKEHDENCREMGAENIIIFNSKYAAKPLEATTTEDPKYNELARAEFMIQTDDKDLKEKFDSIKMHILKNRKNT